MRPYQTIKFIEFPDIADICSQGRKSSVGRLRRGTVQNWDGKTVHNDHGYIRNSESKKQIRRQLKRVDRHRSLQEEFKIVAMDDIAFDQEMVELDDFYSDYEASNDYSDYEYDDDWTPNTSEIFSDANLLSDLDFDYDDSWYELEDC